MEDGIPKAGSKSKKQPEATGDPDFMNRDIHRPYWKRAHRDWRIWFGMILMLIAMLVYLMTGDLRWPFHGHPQPMVPIAG